MDDFVKLLIEEQNNANGLLLQLLESGYEEWDHIAAIEGPDDKLFYFDFIESYLAGKKVYMLPCGGKDSMIKFKEAAEAYEWKTTPSILYICDKDFDDYIGCMINGIYYTDTYSIENYFSNSNYARYVIDKFSSRPLTATERSRFLESFLKKNDEMVKHVLCYSAFICEIRNGGHHPDFEKIGIDIFFHLNGSFILPRKNRINRVKSEIEIPKSIKRNAVLSRARSFKLLNAAQWLRGKLALQIAKKAYELARNDMPSRFREKLPGSNYFGKEAFAHAKSFLGDIQSLKNYCAAA